MYGGLRTILHWLLLVTFALYVEGGAVAWGLYAMFADQIAAAYCVNPTNPCCRGKCHMASATEKDRRQGTSAEIAAIKTLPFVESSAIPAPLAAPAESFPTRNAGPPPVGHPASIDHPPSSGFII